MYVPKVKIKRSNFYYWFLSDSGVESSATNIGFEGAISDNEQPPPNIEDESSPAPAPPSLEDAMQRLAETIKEFDSHAVTNQEQDKIQNDTCEANGNGQNANQENGEKDDNIPPKKEEAKQQNLSQGQIYLVFYNYNSHCGKLWNNVQKFHGSNHFCLLLFIVLILF